MKTKEDSYGSFHFILSLKIKSIQTVENETRCKKIFQIIRDQMESK